MWSGSENDIKSYSYSGKQFPRGQKISSIRSMRTSARWDYDTDVIRANVAYDIFTATDFEHVTSSGDYEVSLNFACLRQRPFWFL